MSIDPNDPRLTAYALGELGEVERNAFEAEMDAEAYAEVAAIRKAADSLRAELAGEPVPSLEPEQVQTIHDAARPRHVWRWIGTVAATLLVVFGIWAVSLQRTIGALEAPRVDGLLSEQTANGMDPSATSATRRPGEEREETQLEEAIREALDLVEYPRTGGDQLLERAQDALRAGQQQQQQQQQQQSTGPVAGAPNPTSQPRGPGRGRRGGNPPGSPSAEKRYRGVSDVVPPSPAGGRVPNPSGRVNVGMDARGLHDIAGGENNANQRVVDMQKRVREQETLIAAARQQGFIATQAQPVLQRGAGIVEDLQTRLREQEALIAAARQQGFNVAVGQPELSGVVSVVGARGRLLTLNVTENPDRVALVPGLSFAIHADGTYKGEAVVTDVQGNFVFCRITPAPNDAPPIVVGDRANTRTDNLDDTIPNTEAYDLIVENPFLDADVDHTSTFSIDVDTASYANVRRFLNQDQLPPPDAVRIEELINYFEYDYEVPGESAEHPFRAHVEIAGCPWNPEHRLARIGLQGRVIPFAERPAMNLVFLIDVSGSMSAANKLELVKQSMSKLASELLPTDQIAIVVYAGAAGLVLDTTPGNEREKILEAIRRLSAGGSTNGGQGIQLAYDTAVNHFIEGGVNRVILATDGDFNVGVSDHGSLLRMIEEKAKSDVFLSVLGFGMGNYKDDLLEKLSNSGNGNYAYIDSLDEACRVLVDGVGGTLITIAKDVKVQIFFNPKHVAGYRLIGYENRMLENQDFNDDTVDAGEIGVGHAVTALYEIVPAGVELPGPQVDQNPFVQEAEVSPVAGSDAWFRLRMRYKQPEGETSTLLEEDAADSGLAFDKASENLQWASAVAGFGMLLRKSAYSGSMTFDAVMEIAGSSMGDDNDGYRNEFLGLVRQAKLLWNR